MKRPRDPDLHVVELPPPHYYMSFIPAAMRRIFHSFTSQEIAAVETTPPTPNGNAPKRRAIARANISTMPGHFPASSEPPEERSTPRWPNTPSPSISPSRPGDRPAQPQAHLSARQRLVTWVYSWLEDSQTTIASSNDNATRSRREVSPATASTAPPVPAKDRPVEPYYPQSQATKEKWLSITERLAMIREKEARGEKVPSDMRQSYATASSIRVPTQKQTSSPRTEINNRQSFRRSHNAGLGRSVNEERDSAVEGLLQRLEIATRDSAEETRFRELQKLRGRRLEDEKGRTGRRWERREKEHRIREEERLLEEQKAQDELQARQEEERRVEEEQKALEEARAAEEARKNLLIQPLEPKWTTIVDNAMRSTNAREAFSKGPDGSDINRYILGRILPQPGESAIRKSMGGSQGPGDWLSDECVDSFIAMIVARRLEQEGYVKGPTNIPSIASYLSAFWKTYTERGAKALSGWSRRKGMAGKKLLSVENILFPINTGNHWILTVISPKSRTIEVFDSAGGSSSRFFKFARDWLEMELGGDYNADEWQQISGNSSMQQNCNDCGVFTCVNALATAKGKPPTAVVSTDGMHDARNMMVAVLINGGFKDDWEL